MEFDQEKIEKKQNEEQDMVVLKVLKEFPNIEFKTAKTMLKDSNNDFAHVISELKKCD